MKSTLSLLTISIMLLTSCHNSTKTAEKTYMESEPAFFELRHGAWLTNKWVRKPENLLAIHESFKKVGYKKLIHDNLLLENPLIIQDIYINKQGKHLLDSLELTYNLPDVRDSYYRGFWQRRKAEKNDLVVYNIIQEINMALKDKTENDGSKQHTHSELINDTLISLLQIEFRPNKPTEKEAQFDFETLRRLGFHQSAYNLLFHSTQYNGLKWNRDSLEKTLSQSDKFVYPWFPDYSK